MLLFFALLSFSLAIAGATAFVIFWPLALVHMRDRQPAMRAALVAPAFIHPVTMWWLLNGEYRTAGDRNLNGLATPARIALTVIIVGLVGAVVFWLWDVSLQ